MRLNVVRGESKEVEERGNQSKIMVFVYWRMKWLTVYYKRAGIGAIISASKNIREQMKKGVFGNRGLSFGENSLVKLSARMSDKNCTPNPSSPSDKKSNRKIPTQKKMFQAIEHFDCTRGSSISYYLQHYTAKLRGGYKILMHEFLEKNSYLHSLGGGAQLAMSF